MSCARWLLLHIDVIIFCRLIFPNEYQLSTSATQSVATFWASLKKKLLSFICLHLLLLVEMFLEMFVYKDFFKVSKDIQGLRKENL